MENIDISKHEFIIIKEDYISLSDIKKVKTPDLSIEKRTISFYKKYIIDTIEVSIEKSFGLTDIPGHQRIKIDDIYCMDDMGIFGFKKNDYQNGQDIYTKSTTQENIITMMKGCKHSVWILSKGMVPTTPDLLAMPSAPAIPDDINSFVVTTGKLYIGDSLEASQDQIISIDAMNGIWEYLPHNEHPKILHRGFVNHGFDSFIGFINITGRSLTVSDTQRLDIQLSNGRYQVKAYLSEGVCIGISITSAEIIKRKKSIKDKIKGMFN